VHVSRGRIGEKTLKKTNFQKKRGVNRGASSWETSARKRGRAFDGQEEKKTDFICDGGKVGVRSLFRGEKGGSRKGPANLRESECETSTKVTSRSMGDKRGEIFQRGRNLNHWTGKGKLNVIDRSRGEKPMWQEGASSEEWEGLHKNKVNRPKKVRTNALKVLVGGWGRTEIIGVQL